MNLWNNKKRLILKDKTIKKYRFTPISMIKNFVIPMAMLLPLMPSMVSAETDFEPSSMEVIGASGASTYTRKVATSIGIYAKKGTVPAVRKSEGTWGGVTYHVLEVDSNGDTFIQVDYAGANGREDQPKYLNNFYDTSLTDEYYWVGGINSGFFENNSITSPTYGQPVGVVKRDGALEHFVSTTGTDIELAAGYGTGFVSTYLNDNGEMELIYNGWSGGNFYKYYGDPNPNSWEYGDYDNYEDGVSGTYTLIVDGDPSVHWGNTDGSGASYWNNAGSAMTLFGQKADGTKVLVNVEKGISNTQQIALMQNLGCVDAIRFDGGGSSQMTFDRSLTMSHYYINLSKEYTEGDTFDINTINFDIYGYDGAYHYATFADMTMAEVHLYKDGITEVATDSILESGDYTLVVTANGSEQRLPFTVKDRYWSVTIDMGYENDSDQILSIKNGETVTAPLTPTRDGYMFTGWIDADGEPFDFSMPITSDTTITASWLKIEIVDYEITVNQTDYFIGDSFNESSVTVKALYNDGHSVELNPEDYHFLLDNNVFETEGDVLITILNNSDETIGTFTVSVNAIILQSISASLIPEKVYINDEITAEDIIVIGTYNNGDEEQINDGVTIDADTSIEGETTFVIHVDDLTTTIDVFVQYDIIEQPITAITIDYDVWNINDAVPVPTVTLQNGDKVTLDESKGQYTYAIEKRTSTLTDVKAESEATVGEVTIVYNIQRYDDEMTIQTDEFRINGFIKDYSSISAFMEKTEYIVGETFTADDIVIVKHMIDENAEDEVVQNSMAQIDMSNVKMDEAGTYTVNISVTLSNDPVVSEVIEPITVTFVDPLNLPKEDREIISLSLNETPQYTVNGSMDQNKFEIIAEYTDGSFGVINKDDVVISNFSNVSAGRFNMHVVYEYQINNTAYMISSDLPYIVKDFDSLMIDSTNYTVYQNDPFNMDDVVISKVLGSIKVAIDHDYVTFDPSTVDTSMIGNTVVNATYHDPILNMDFNVGSFMVNVLKHDDETNPPVIDGNHDIDQSRMGSITLYKYASDDGKYIDGNFMEQNISEVSNQPLKDVGFTVLKVGDLYQYPNSENDTVGLYYTIDDDLKFFIESLGFEIPMDTVEGHDVVTTDTLNDILADINTTEGDYGLSNDGSTIPSVQLIEYIKEHGITMALTDNNGKTTLTNVEQGLYIVAETETPSTTGDGFTSTPSRASAPFLMPIPTTNIVDIDGVEAGTTWIYDVVAYPKSEMMTIRKDIVYSGNDAILENDADGLTVTTDAMVGENVEFLLTTSLPKLQPQINGVDNTMRKYVITDTLSEGLYIDDFNESSFTITYGNGAYNDSNNAVFAPMMDYVAEYDTESNQFRIIFTPQGLSKMDAIENDQHVYVRYLARMTVDAGQPIGGIKEERNSFTLTYGTSVTKDMLFESNSDIRVYTYELDLTKQFSNAAVDMSDVTFSIDRVSGVTVDDVQTKEGMKFTELSDGTYTVWDGNGDFTEALHVNNEGLLIVSGLDDGLYVINELTTAHGYNLLKDPIVLKITSPINEDGTIESAVLYDKDGNEIRIGTLYSVGIVDFTIENNERVTPLQTGGEGNYTVVIIGSLFICTAAMALVKKKYNI